MATGTFDPELDKLYWQIEALKGQVTELERERDRTANLVWFLKTLLVRALRGLGIPGDFNAMSLNELTALFEQITLNDYRFSRCPQAAEYHCRPLAMQVTRDGELVYCEDCGWHVAGNALPPPTPAAW